MYQGPGASLINTFGTKPIKPLLPPLLRPCKRPALATVLPAARSCDAAPVSAHAHAPQLHPGTRCDIFNGAAVTRQVPPEVLNRWTPSCQTVGVSAPPPRPHPLPALVPVPVASAPTTASQQPLRPSQTHAHNHKPPQARPLSCWTTRAASRPALRPTPTSSSCPLRRRQR